MKRYITILTLTLLSLPVFASRQLIERADSAYNSDDYALALSLYTEVASESTSSELLYNIGNTRYRLGDLSGAILCYERALKIDPTNDDARENLAFVNNMTIDEIKGESGSFLSNAATDIALSMTADTWAVLALILFIITLGAVAIYIFASSIAIRKVGFFGGLVIFAIFVVTLIFAIYANGLRHDHDDAVITAPSTILSTKPRAPKDRSEEAMLLHEGTKIRILDSVNTYDSNGNRWYDVQIDNNHRAWVKDSDIERI